MRSDVTILSLIFGGCLLACSSDEAVNEPTGGVAGAAGVGGAQNSKAGASSLGGSGGVSSGAGGGTQSAAGQANTNAGCPTWPAGKLFPTIGPYFYGPNPGPCSMTTGTESWTYSYDAAGKLTRGERSDGGTVITFEYEQDRLVRETSTEGSNVTLTTYAYAANAVTYTTTSPAGTTSGYEYALDAQGYPISTQVVSGTGSAANPTHYVYVYESCRLSRRLAFNAANVEIPTYVATYTYDDAGRLARRTTQGREEVYDYSCW